MFVFAYIEVVELFQNEKSCSNQILFCIHVELHVFTVDVYMCRCLYILRSFKIDLDLTHKNISFQ